MIFIFLLETPLCTDISTDPGFGSSCKLQRENDFTDSVKIINIKTSRLGLLGFETFDIYDKSNCYCVQTPAALEAVEN